jgi:ABC-type bacteriocin/lantibiotic exporter with double-glycine peptidase domain
MILENINKGVFDAPELKDRPLRRFFRLLSIDKKDLYRVYILAIASGLISLSLPLAIQAIIGQIMAAQISTSLYVLIGAVTIATFFSGAFQVMQFRIIEDIQRRIFTRTSFEFALKIPRFKVENIISDYPPEMINRFFETLNIEKGLPKIIIDLSISLVSVVFGLLLLCFYHPFFVFFAFLLVLFIYIVFTFTGDAGLRTKLLESTYKYKVVHWLQELGRSFITFKMVNDPNISIYNTDKIVSHYLDARQKHFNILVAQYIMVIVFRVLVISGLLIMGALLVVNQEINLGQFVAAEIIIFIVINALEKLIHTLESVYEVLAGMEKIAQVLSVSLENDGSIDFKNVDIDNGIKISIAHLTYSAFEKAPKALDNINLNIAAGERVCIVGKNGSGKSTLVHLLSSIYSNYEGSLMYNDVPAQNYNLASLRANIGCCFYPEDIFAGTIVENITMGNSAYFERMLQVSKSIGLEDFVRSLPAGYETVLYPENRKYPKSIVKKIILARNIVKLPKLLILDDLLAQIEHSTRYKIIDYLTDIRHQWTLVLISNDIHIARKCDRIVALDDGKIIADCNFEQSLTIPAVVELLNANSNDFR